MTDIEVVTATLEQCAELDVDLTSAIYTAFFDNCQAAVPLMGHSDEHMRGRMAEQVFELILDDTLRGAGGYLGWEVDNHVSAYGVQVGMYRAFFEAVRDAVSGVLGAAWNDDYARAWNGRIDTLLADIHGHAQRTGT